MKVLVVANKLSLDGGAQTYLWKLLEALIEQGITVDCALTHTPSHLPKGPRFYKMEDLPRLVRDIRFDIVHVHSPGLPFEKCLRIIPDYVKRVITLHDYAFLCPGSEKFFRFNKLVCPLPIGLHCLWNTYLRYCNRTRIPHHVLREYLQISNAKRGLSQFNQIIVASQHMAKRVTAEGISPHKIRILPYFVPLSIEQDTFSFNQSDPPLFLFMGRLLLSKGVEEALRALTHVKGPFRFDILGDGPLLPALKTLVKNLNLTNCVHFLGWSDRLKVMEKISSARALILPSLWDEPFGIVGIEAMAMGRPVVAFDVGGVSEWLKDCQTGFLIPRGDVLALSKRLQQLLNDISLASRLGAQAQKHAKSHFNRKAHVNHLISIYNEAMSHKAITCS